MYIIGLKCLSPSGIVGSGKFLEHKAKNPLGGAYLNTPLPLPSVLPCWHIVLVQESDAHYTNDYV